MVFTLTNTLKLLLFKCVFLRECMSYVCGVRWMPEQGVGAPAATVTGDCEQHCMAVGNQTGYLETVCAPTAKPSLQTQHSFLIFWSLYDSLSQCLFSLSICMNPISWSKHMWHLHKCPLHTLLSLFPHVTSLTSHATELRTPALPFVIHKLLINTFPICMRFCSRAQNMMFKCWCGPAWSVTTLNTCLTKTDIWVISKIRMSIEFL